MTPEIKYETEGFVHDAVYASHLKKIIDNYQNDFAPLEKVNILVKEKTFHQLEDNDQTASIKFSHNNKICDITIFVWYNYNNKGQINSTPTPHEVFETINAALQQAIEEWSVRKNG